MNLSNIKVGDIYKNYRAICDALEVETKTSNSKKAQLKEWERFFKYEKDGYKFIITHIYEIPLPENHNKTRYITTIQRLILDKVVQFGNRGQLFISKSELLKELRMINENYTFAKYKQLRFAKHMEISLEQVEEFYMTSDDLLKRNIEAALNSLRSQSLIFWTHAMTLCFIETDVETNRHNEIKAVKTETKDQYGDTEVTFKAARPVTSKSYRKATNEEIELVLKAEREVLLKYNCESINDTFKRGIGNKFYKDVRELLFDNYNIYWYFNSYEIIANEDHIYTKYDELLSLELEAEEREASLSELNSEIVNKINSNAKNRHDKASALYAFGEKDKKTARRSDEDYLKNTYKLTDTLIKSNAAPISYKLKNKIN
jgi:hypothetical protein